MARLIFISPYLKGGKDAKHLGNHTRYIATREGVEKLISSDAAKPVTKQQTQFIRRLIRSYPEAKELAEYADYRAAPNRKSASEFIDQAREQFLVAADQRENYLDYVAHRPGVRSDGDHGLWDANGKVPVLSKAVEEVANHEGIVWTPIVSLRREDAERLGYTDVKNWRALVKSCLPEIATGYKIPLEHLRWYAAMHEKEKHIHIHLVLFSSDPKEGYLSKDGIRSVKSAFARRMFQQDLISVYKRQTEYRDTLQQEAKERMDELIRLMQSGTIRNETLETLTAELAERLRHTSGKKVYGYLPPQVKRIVDAIVDELAKDARVAAAYALWQEMRDEVCRTYTDELPERLPLSAQKEFKTVRNMVVREGLKLSEQVDTLEDGAAPDEPEDADEPSPIWEAIRAPKARKRNVYEQARRYRAAKDMLSDTGAAEALKLDAISELEQLWDEGYIVAAHQIGKAYRDGLGVEIDRETAIEWFRRSADGGNDYSEYALGKLLLERGNALEGVNCLARAAKRGNQYAQYRLGKLYLEGTAVPKDVETALSYFGDAAANGNQYAQYVLGKLFLLGQNVPRDEERALRYLERSAEQGNVYTWYLLDHRNDVPAPHVGAAVVGMLHHMGNIFQEQSMTDSTRRGMQIDRKRRRQLQEKRLAMVHKPDDHEEEENNVSNQTMR